MVGPIFVHDDKNCEEGVCGMNHCKFGPFYGYGKKEFNLCYRHIYGLPFC